MKARQKIAPDLTLILLNRIDISRELKVFSLTEIATNWQITPRTLFRYSSPKDREYSRLIARKATEAYRTKDRTVCQLCEKKLEGHDRCTSCTMLVHGEPECSCVVMPRIARLMVQISI